ncbi:zonular occludens toxin domain-containing protein [Paraburkholderia flava]|uniref:zonular occludens toxin domain-containing protein n=1 Tax=Paraburkholderia flava TaxID=2547393 RepID=UPI0010611E37|nr:zonular occludens toxin domain-containing protein [Paraburkholderia flava]
MTITLVTGVPGSGKSLFAVASARREVKAGRRLLVDGVRDLALDHEDVDETWLRKWFNHVVPLDLIIVDEAQRIWPPTSVSVKPGEDIEKLHVHRHMGVDFILITQHPQRINKTVRDLVGRHVHVRKIFGLNRAVLYEWDHCHNVGSLKDAVKTFWKYPRDVFKLYTSAELHTKPKAVLPKSLFFIPVALIVAVVGAYFFHRYLHGGFGAGSHASPGTVAGSSVGAASAAHVGGASGVASGSWRVAGRYVSGGLAFVVLANEKGVFRLVDAAGFKGDGVRTAGVVDGERVASWTGSVGGAGADMAVTLGGHK